MSEKQLETLTKGDVGLVYSLRQTWLLSNLEAHRILGMKTESRIVHEKFSFKASYWKDLKGNSSYKFRI